MCAMIPSQVDSNETPPAGPQEDSWVSPVLRELPPVQLPSELDALVFSRIQEEFDAPSSHSIKKPQPAPVQLPRAEGLAYATAASVYALHAAQQLLRLLLG